MGTLITSIDASTAHTSTESMSAHLHRPGARGGYSGPETSPARPHHLPGCVSATRFFNCAWALTLVRRHSAVCCVRGRTELLLELHVDDLAPQAFVFRLQPPSIRLTPRRRYRNALAPGRVSRAKDGHRQLARLVRLRAPTLVSLRPTALNFFLFIFASLRHP